MRDSHVKGPGFAALRPCKQETDPSSFPVYPDLVDRLVANKEQPDPDGVIPHVMAVCSAYSYAGFQYRGDPGTLAVMMARLGLDENDIRLFEQRVDALYIASAAYLVQDKDRRIAILCYRGTQPEDIISILTDADVRPETLAVELEGRRHEVHAGFYRNVRATRHHVVEALERAVRGESVAPDEPGTKGDGLEALYITGHSLGGAMAAIMAMILVHEPRYRHITERLKGVYTFGQPMIGGPDLARACEEAPGPHDTHVLRDRLLRYIFDRDVVPALPPRPVGPYAPFGREFLPHCLKGVGGAPTAGPAASPTRPSLSPPTRRSTPSPCPPTSCARPRTATGEGWRSVSPTGCGGPYDPCRAPAPRAGRKSPNRACTTPRRTASRVSRWWRRSPSSPPGSR
ncbi:hypothetical protein [Streptomyces sp. NPDC046909]|uniref:lipase family protein n=1 Tax=Streptomyces sp. NPDC046909 TaxID=3155617 RepID=UPI0033CA60C6